MRRFKVFMQILSLFVFVLCCGYMGLYLYEYYNTKSDIAIVREAVEKAAEEASGEKKYAENGMLAEFYDLYCQNEDMVGWILIEGTEVNYPILYKNTDNDYYLHRNFEKKYSDGGMLFLDKECSLAAPSDNLIIYGHNMKNGTMFAPLLKYADADFLAEHKTIMFSNLYENFEYTIISVFKTQVDSADEFKYYNFVEAESEADFENFVEAAKRLSIHSIDESAVYGDELLTLSTCSYNRKNERFVIVAKRTK